MTPGRGRTRPARYRAYVEAGLAETDEEVRAQWRQASLGIGPDDFLEELQRRHRESASRINTEDVAFRRPARRMSPEAILQAVCQEFRSAVSDLPRHRRNDVIKPVAAALLMRAGGLTQRETARHLGLTTGAAVCLQLKRLHRVAATDARAVVDRLARKFNI